MKKILITGSSGFVGRYFMRRLADDNLLYCVDIKTGIDARDFFRESNDTKFDLIIHLAAVVGGREVIEREPLKVAVDLSIDAEFFQYCMRTKPEAVVYFSSSAAYPIAYQQRGYQRKLSEDMIDFTDMMSPDMTYGLAKLAGEYQAQFLRVEGIRTYVFRPFSGYGADQDLCYPFPAFIDRARRRETPFQVWGDGTACRDFIHIEDIVEAVLKTIDLDIQEPINLGTGEATSFNALASACMACAKYKTFDVTIENLLDKPEGVHYRVADNSKLSSFYTPKISLSQGIYQAMKWFI